MINGETTFTLANFELATAVRLLKNEANSSRAGGDWETGVIGMLNLHGIL